MKMDINDKIEQLLKEDKVAEAKATDEEVGEFLADMLNLKKKGDRYNTSWGSKTSKGLFLTLKRVIDQRLTA